jgi:hypothetical protein
MTAVGSKCVANVPSGVASRPLAGLENRHGHTGFAPRARAAHNAPFAPSRNITCEMNTQRPACRPSRCHSALRSAISSSMRDRVSPGGGVSLSTAMIRSAAAPSAAAASAAVRLARRRAV